MKISLEVKNNKVLDFAYQCKTCIYCQASASVLSKFSINKSLKKITEIIAFVDKFLQILMSNFHENGSNLKNFLKKRIFQEKNVFVAF